MGKINIARNNPKFSASSFQVALIWAVASFILLFKVWDNIGPAVLSMSGGSHAVQLLAMAIVFLAIWGIPGWIYMKIFG